MIIFRAIHVKIIVNAFDCHICAQDGVKMTTTILWHSNFSFILKHIYTLSALCLRWVGASMMTINILVMYIAIRALYSYPMRWLCLKLSTNPWEFKRFTQENRDRIKVASPTNIPCLMKHYEINEMIVNLWRKYASKMRKNSLKYTHNINKIKWTIIYFKIYINFVPFLIQCI